MFVRAAWKIPSIQEDLLFLGFLLKCQPASFLARVENISFRAASAPGCASAGLDSDAAAEPIKGRPRQRAMSRATAEGRLASGEPLTGRAGIKVHPFKRNPHIVVFLPPPDAEFASPLR